MDSEHTRPGKPWTSPQQRAENLAENPFAGQGPVVLDVGGDVGALVLKLPASMEGVEIEIVRVSEPKQDHDHLQRPGQDHHGHRQIHEQPRHVAVVARQTNHGVVHSAVFPDLVQGTYQLNERSGPVLLRVEVTGGAVAQTDWPND